MKVRLKEWRLVDLGEVEFGEEPVPRQAFEHHGVEMVVESVWLDEAAKTIVHVKRVEDGHA